MNLQSTLTIHGFGTAEGACKAVNTRGDKAARQCGGPDDDAPASTIQISNWLDDKGLSSSLTKGVAQQLTALGMSPKLMKLPLTITTDTHSFESIPGAVGGYDPETKKLSLDTSKVDASDVVHELTHWAMFSQMPGITKPNQFLPNIGLPLADAPELRADTQAMMQEFAAAEAKAEKKVRDGRGADERGLPIDKYEFLNMEDKDARAVGAPSGYALTQPAEWVAEAAIGHAPPATVKLVRNLWSGKYIK